MTTKRGGGQSNLKLNTDIGNNMVASNEQIIQLHEALDELAVVEPRLAKVVEMRYFGGASRKPKLPMRCPSVCGLCKGIGRRHVCY